jgi:hypothetical protein
MRKCDGRGYRMQFSDPPGVDFRVLPLSFDRPKEVLSPPSLSVMAGESAHPLSSPPRFGIVTVYDGSPKYECAMPLWCTSAKELSRHVAASSRVQE